MRTEDGSIIYRCLHGEPGVFGLLVDKYKAGIYAYVYTRLPSFQDAQDVTQEVFLQAYRDLRTLRRWESFVFWLYRIAHNCCAKYLRARSRQPDRESIEDQDPKALDASSLKSYRDSQVNESLWEAIYSLPGTYRQVLMLHYFGGMNSSEIAKALATSPTAIRMRLSRARAQLKEEIVAMMDTAFEGQRLQASFTFRIVEAVKRIKINPMPRMTVLPWGLSLAAGIAILVMTLGSQIAIHQLSERLALPGEIMPEVREMPVDILSAPGTSIIAGNQGDIDGGGMDPRNPQNSFLLAPAKGGGTWTQKADMPTARYLSGSAVVDGKIYVIGGAPVPFGITAVVEEYDPATDTWTRLADMPTARQGVVAAAVDGIIYAIGAGAVGPKEATVEAYNPATDKWTKKADMPTGRGMAAIAVMDGIIYVIGGQSGALPVIQSTVEAYDPATDTWTTKADMPTARYNMGACVIDGRIYVSGGATKWGEQSGDFSSVPTVEVYDPATDIWTQASDMPVVRFGHSASAVDGKMYIIGGRDEETMKLWEAGQINADEMEELYSIVYVYDPATDTWTTAANPLPTARGYLTAAVVDGKIYAIGGAQGSTKLSTVEEYDPGLSGNIAVTNPAGKLLTTWGKVRTAE